MERFSLCRICLSDNVRMYLVADKKLQELYERLTNTPFVTQDNRPLSACFFCYAKLKQCCWFMQKCKEGEELFYQMLNGDYEQKPLKLKPVHYGGYIKTAVQHIDTNDLDSVIKEEAAESLRADTEMKEECHGDEASQDMDNTFSLPEDLPQHSDSEDDLPLMKFKTEAEEDREIVPKKRIKKRVRKPDCSEIILSKEEQIQNLQARSKSMNYINSPYKCSYCFKGFVDVRAYGNHKLKHDVRSGPHVCDICQMRYRSQQLLRTHANNAHVRIYKCNKCGYISHTGKPTSYLSHMRKRHPTEHVCNICGDSFVGKHGLQMHKKKTHLDSEKMPDPDNPEDPATGRFCKECNIQFYSLDAWKRHILSSIKHTLKTEERNRKKVTELPNCPVCSCTIRQGELDSHLSLEVERLQKLSGSGSKRKLSVNSSANLAVPGSSTSQDVLEDEVDVSGCLGSDVYQILSLSV
ncbi:unnamed protein product [Spodoptera exigua]|nr:unnamed protein product [Spodoptera exigua]